METIPSLFTSLCTMPILQQLKEQAKLLDITRCQVSASWRATYVLRKDKQQLQGEVNVARHAIWHKYFNPE